MSQIFQLSYRVKLKVYKIIRGLKANIIEKIQCEAEENLKQKFQTKVDSLNSLHLSKFVLYEREIARNTVILLTNVKEYSETERE